MQSPVLGSIAEIVWVTHRHSASTAVPIGGAGDGLTADMLACTVNDRKMGSVAVIFQHVEGLGTDFHWFASAVYMVIVIGGLDKGSGEHGKVPMPSTWSVYRIDGGPSVVGSIQPEGVGG